MTAMEVAAFDASLTPEERARLAGEMRLELGLGEALAAGGSARMQFGVGPR